MAKNKGYSKGALTPEFYEPTEQERRDAAEIKKQWQACVDYKTSQGLYDQWNEYDRFWDSDQWPQPTERTKNFPRPVSNQFAEIIEQKVAALLYDLPTVYFEPKENYKSEEDIKRFEIVPFNPMEKHNLPTAIDAAEMLTHLTKYQSATPHFNLEELLDLYCRSAAVLGNGILFAPWDNTIIGGGPNSRYIGDIVGYEIDPSNFHPGDPKERDMQKQPWIIIEERVPKAYAKEHYKEFNKSAAEALKADPQGKTQVTYEQERNEMREIDYVDLLHRWRKVQEEIEVEMVDEEGEAPRKIVRYRHRVEYQVECQDKIIRHEEDISPESGLYPFVHFQWYPRRKSFFGKPESKDLIQNQKETNRLAGITLMAAYGTGVPNIRYKPDFVNKSDLPEGPGGGMIPDNSPIGHWGVDYMRPPSVQPYIGQVREILKADNRDTAGIHEAFTGKNPVGGQLNASALIALQEAAGIRIRGIQRRLNRSLVDLGRILLAHWKENYKEDRLIKITGESMATGYVWFNSTHIKDMEFDVKCRAGSASPFSSSLQLTFLDRLFYEGRVLSPEEYLELMPPDVFPRAQLILRRREEKRQMEEMAAKMTQIQLIQEMVAQIIQQAQASGVPIDPQAMQHMLDAVQKIAVTGQPGQAPEAQPQPMMGGGGII